MIHHPSTCPCPALCGCQGIYDFDSCEDDESSSGECVCVGGGTFHSFTDL